MDSTGLAWKNKWVFNSVELLNDFLKRVVVSRRDVGIRKWACWLREVAGRRGKVVIGAVHLVWAGMVARGLK